MNTYFLSVYYQVLIFLRVKIAVFFTFVFPTFIFICFSSIWGYQNPTYYKFILTGVIIMTVMSDALFSVGDIIANYYQEGFVKFYRSLPTSMMKYLGALISSRILISFASSLLLLTIAIVFFEAEFSGSEFLYIIAGIISAFFMFSLVGLTVAFSMGDKGGSKSINNFIFFILLFLSDLVYPLSELNPSLGKLVSFLPIDPVIELTRGDINSIIPVTLWALIFLIVFYITYRTKRMSR